MIEQAESLKTTQPRAAPGVTSGHKPGRLKACNSQSSLWLNYLAMPSPVISKLIRVMHQYIIFLHQSDAYFIVSVKNVVMIGNGSISGLQPDSVTPIILTPGAARGCVVSGFQPFPLENP